MPDGGRGRIRFHKEERLRHWIVVAVVTETELLTALHFSDSQSDTCLPDVALLCALMRLSRYEAVELAA